MKTQRNNPAAARLLGEQEGQSLLEIALMMPLLILLMAYAVDFGYFFMAAATIASSARSAAQYSVLGYSSPSQSSLPVAGPATTTNSVTATAMADLGSLAGSATTTSVQVCSKSLGLTGGIPNCSTYGVAGSASTPGTDPESPVFTMQRVDVTYTVQPPIPMSFFSVSLLPSLKFHRQVSMRAMD